MSDTFLYALIQFSEFAPCALLCYRPFLDRNLKISKCKLFSLLFAVMGIQFVFNLFFPVIFPVVRNFSFFIFLFIYLVIFYFTIQARLSLLLFVFFAVAAYAGVIVGIAHSVDIYLHPFVHRAFNRYDLSFTLLILFFLLITMPLINVLYKKLEPLVERKDSVIWTRIWVIPFTFIIILLIFESVFQDKSVQIWQSIVVLLAFGVGFVLVYSTVIQMLNNADENAALKEKVKTIDVQLILQKKAYISMRKHIEEAKKARHDLRHHLSVMEACLQSNNMEALKKYLEEYKSSLPDNVQLNFCENYAVNAIVTHYMSIAKTESIKVSANLQVPQDSGIADSDLCIIFGNCFENALEACQRMEGDDRYIQLKSSVQGNSLAVMIDNSFNGIIQKENDCILSNKRNHEEGIGISSVKAVCSKYRGFLKLYYDEKEFHTSIVLHSN